MKGYEFDISKLAENSIIMKGQINDVVFGLKEISDKIDTLIALKHRLTRAHREKQLKTSCQALHNAPPNRT